MKRRHNIIAATSAAIGLLAILALSLAGLLPPTAPASSEVDVQNIVAGAMKDLLLKVAETPELKGKVIVEVLVDVGANTAIKEATSIRLGEGCANMLAGFVQDFQPMQSGLAATSAAMDLAYPVALALGSFVAASKNSEVNQCSVTEETWRSPGVSEYREAWGPIVERCREIRGKWTAKQAEAFTKAVMGSVVSELGCDVKPR